MTIPANGHRLLHGAVSYGLASARFVTPDLLRQPTPCTGWDLRMLLSHVSESLDALAEGLTSGTVNLGPAGAAGPGAELTGVRVRCARLLAAAAGNHPDRRIAIAGQALNGSVLVCAGAIEIAVHGWDIAAACGSPWPIPAGLASDLLQAAALLVTQDSRGGLFAGPVPVPEQAAPGDRLVAFLGRNPDLPAARL